MKKIVFTYGLLAGVIVGSMFFISKSFWDSGAINFDNGQLVGYTTMVIALSMVFFGIRSYRDNCQQGAITFGRAVKVGLLITLVASVMYALSWELSYNTVNQDFMEKYTAYYIEKMEAEGASAEEIAQMKEEWSSMGELYKNPIIRFGFTLMEILPVGLVITLISAALLREPTQAATA